MAEERADQTVESIGAGGGGSASTTVPAVAASGTVTREVPTSALATSAEDIALGTASVTPVLADNPNRKGALIQNTGATNPLRITLDGSDPSATKGILIAAGLTVTLSQPYCPTKVVRAIAVTGSTTVGVTEVV